MKVSEMFNVKEKYSKTHYNCKHGKARETDSEREIKKCSSYVHGFVSFFVSWLTGWFAIIFQFEKVNELFEGSLNIVKHYKRQQQQQQQTTVL